MRNLLSLRVILQLNRVLSRLSSIISTHRHTLSLLVSLLSCVSRPLLYSLLLNSSSSSSYIQVYIGRYPVLRVREFSGPDARIMRRRSRARSTDWLRLYSCIAISSDAIFFCSFRFFTSKARRARLSLLYDAAGGGLLLLHNHHHLLSTRPVHSWRWAHFRSPTTYIPSRGRAYVCAFVCVYSNARGGDLYIYIYLRVSRRYIYIYIIPVARAAFRSALQREHAVTQIGTRFVSEEYILCIFMSQVVFIMFIITYLP